MADDFSDGASVGADGLVFRGGCVRLLPGRPDSQGRFGGNGGPQIYTNAAHIARGLRSVRVTPAGLLQVVLTGATPIMYGAASPDETLAARGISCGPSVGNPSLIRFGTADGPLDLTNPAHWARVAGNQSNVWLLFVSVADRTP